MCLALGKGIATDKEVCDIIEATNGRTVLCFGGGIFRPGAARLKLRLSAKVREKYEHQKRLLVEIRRDPEVANVWDGMLSREDGQSL